MRKFAKLAGVDINKTKPIIARSSPEIATLTAGGQVKLGISIMSASIPSIQAGLVRPLATTAGERSPSLPDVTTATELGFPIVVSSFSGISGPPKLPAAIVDKWNVALQEMVKDPDVVVQLNRIGSVPLYKNSSDFREYVRREAAEIDELWAGK
jgi:tripartite-type tricarboxylate transporter receptor subunit TctC